jgi:hypothetical protein
MNHATFVNMQYKYLLDAFVLWNTLNRVSSIRLNIYCNEFDSRSAYASVREAGSHHTAGAEDPNSILVSNITVEWLTFQLPVYEVPGSSLDPETGSPDRVVSWYSNFQGNTEIIINVVIRYELDLNRPVSSSSHSLFKGLPSRLRPFGL